MSQANNPNAVLTHLAWRQEFESPEVSARLRPICEPANEQNLDRLQSLLASERS